MAKIRKDFRFSEAACSRLAKIAEEQGVTQTEVLEAFLMAVYVPSPVTILPQGSDPAGELNEPLTAPKVLPSDPKQVEEIVSNAPVKAPRTRIDPEKIAAFQRKMAGKK